MKGLLLFALLWTALQCAAADGKTLYASSMRTYSDPAYRGVEGNLYKVSTNNGVTQLLAPVTLDGKTPVGLEGLAIHPTTGAFYGITPENSAVIPRSLVSIDSRTGIVKLIGPLGMPASDIDFDPQGVLFAWLPTTRQIARVDLETGATTAIGKAFEQGTMKGGIALIGGGRAIAATSGGAGTLDTVDIQTGVITPGPRLVGAPFQDLINGLAFSPNGVLYAINTNDSNPPLANLVKIDIQTGKVTNIGPLPNETDALCFGPELAEAKDLGASMEQWRAPLLLLLFAIAVVVVIAATRHRKQ